MGRVINLHRDGLRAVALFAAKLDIRYYLVGVKVEATPDATRVVGTNGHVLGLHHSTQDNSLHEPTELIVPLSVVSLVKRVPPKEVDVLRLESDDDGETWALRDSRMGFGATFKPVEGKFPHYSQVIPQTASGEAASYNPHYLMLVRKAAEILGSKKYGYELAQNGSGGGLVTVSTCPEFVGVVMPMRMEPKRERPRWAAEPLVARKAASAPATEAVA